MSKNRSALVTQCLDNLGVIASGQSTSAEEYAKMDGLIDPGLAKLAGLGIYFVGDGGSEGSPESGEIDDAAFLPIADYIANAACPAFNLPADTKMQALAMQAEMVLKTLSAPARTKRVLRVDSGTLGRGWSRYTGSFN